MSEQIAISATDSETEKAPESLLEKAAVSLPTAPERLTEFGAVGKALYRRIGRFIEDAQDQLDIMLSFQSADQKIEDAVIDASQLEDPDSEDIQRAAADYLSEVEFQQAEDAKGAETLKAEIEKETKRLTDLYNEAVAKRAEKVSALRDAVVAQLDLDIESITAEDNQIALETYKGIDADIRNAIKKLSSTEKKVAEDETLAGFGLPNITGKKASTGKRGAPAGTWKPRFQWVKVTDTNGKVTILNTGGETTAGNIQKVLGINTPGYLTDQMAMSLANGNKDAAQNKWDNSTPDGSVLELTNVLNDKRWYVKLVKGSLAKGEVSDYSEAA